MCPREKFFPQQVEPDPGRAEVVTEQVGRASETELKDRGRSCRRVLGLPQLEARSRFTEALVNPLWKAPRLVIRPYCAFSKDSTKTHKLGCRRVGGAVLTETSRSSQWRNFRRGKSRLADPARQHIPSRVAHARLGPAEQGF